MRRLSIFFIGVILSFAFAFRGYGVVTATADVRSVYVGGMPAGFTLKTGSVQVVGMCEIITENGVISPALEAGIRAGDCIQKAAGIQIESVAELNEIINKNKSKTIELTINREDETLKMSLVPALDKTTNHYRIGILARDSVSGIGTVTYIDKVNEKFGALGHTVLGENAQCMKISEGMVFECAIVGVSRGIRGRAGELKGMFLSEQTIGTAKKLCNCGIFGEISKDFDTKDLISVEVNSNIAQPGKAYIYSTISGICPKRYEIEIVKVDKQNKENKNYVIHIIDDELIEMTGGIVQGMSGSPILQENKLIGAVTHVFLNDPTRGYGIDVETMLNE